jgi:hypothetical protein
MLSVPSEFLGASRVAWASRRSPPLSVKTVASDNSAVPAAAPSAIAAIQLARERPLGALTSACGASCAGRAREYRQSATLFGSCPPQEPSTQALNLALTGPGGISDVGAIRPGLIW